MSDSLWCHGLQYTRLPCPSPSPRVCSNSCPLSRWCCPTISASVAPFPPSFSLSLHQSFPVNQLFTSGGQSIGVFSFSISPSNEYQGWFPLGLTGLIAGWQYTALMYSFPNFKAVHCFTSGSNCCFLTCTQVSQKADKVVWYSHL